MKIIREINPMELHKMVQRGEARFAGWQSVGKCERYETRDGRTFLLWLAKLNEPEEAAEVSFEE